MFRRLYDSNENIYYKNIIWNFVASGINGIESVLILAVASRCVSLQMVGVLTISFTVANLLMSAGKFGVRGYQVTDISGEYSYSSYVASRIISVTFMIALMIVYVIYAVTILKYDWDKTLIIILVSLIYATEVVEDVVLSEFQRQGKLYIGSIMFSIRWSICLLLWSISLFVFKDAIKATVVAFLGALTSLIFFLEKLRRENIFAFDLKNNDGMLVIKKCSTLCLSSFLALYMPNIVKYSIDRCLLDTDQAIYGFITMPIFVVDLVVMIIFQPIISEMAVALYEQEYARLYKKYYYMIIFVAVVSIIAIVMGSMFGVQFLSVLYSFDLNAYRNELVIVMIGATGLAYIGLFAAILTMLRKQTKTMVLYLVTSFIVSVISDRIVSYGIRYGVLLNTITLCIVALVMAMLCHRELKI